MMFGNVLARTCRVKLKETRDAVSRRDGYCPVPAGDPRCRLYMSPAMGQPHVSTILIVGGYGAVGRHAARELASGNHRIIVAGRRIAPAMATAAELGVEARRIDLDESATWQQACVDVDLVLMCMDQRDTAFVEFILGKAIHYVDIAASDDFFIRLEALPTPRRSGVLLSVGLAPGLTNLMAASCAVGLEGPLDIRIGLLFGLNDNHGRAGVEWTVGKLVAANREPGSAVFDFGYHWGRRRLHRLDFSDQHALMRTLPQARAATYLGLDSRLATTLLFALAGHVAGSRSARDLAVAAFRPIGLGTRACNVAVSVTGERDGHCVTRTMRFYASGESATTAKLATLMTSIFLEDPVPGIWHSHQVLDPAAVLAEAECRAVGTFEATG